MIPPSPGSSVYSVRRSMARIYWRPPALMLGSLLLGATIALGHHVFYNSLNGHPAPTAFDEYKVLGTHISAQQANTAIGTAFAFMVKACLVLSVSVAYLQAVLWNAAKSDNTRTTIANMDVMMAAMGNWLALTKMSTWWRRPMLLLVALVAWTIPIASIVAPATLSIGAETLPAENRSVPAVAFDSLNLVAEMPYMTALGVERAYAKGDRNQTGISNMQAYYAYNGPSNAVRKVAVAAAAQGKLLPVEAPAPNSSWVTQFLGPSLQCRSVNDTFKRAIQESLVDYTLAGGPDPGYVAWHPVRVSAASSMADLLPFVRGSFPYDSTLDMPRLNHALSSQHGNVDATLFVAVTPSLMAYTMTDYGSLQSLGSWSRDKPPTIEDRMEVLFGDHAPASTILRCDVHNATYQTRFNFINGAQEVEVDVTDVEDRPLITEWAARSLWDNETLYHDAQMPQPCNYLAPYLESNSPCYFNTTVLRTLSYQAVMDALTELLSGTVHWVSNDEAGMSVNMNASVASTVLTQSPELAFLEDFNLINNGTWPTLQKIQPTWKSSYYTVLNRPKNVGAGLPLQQALEQLFQNITISLMSSPELQPDEASPFYPPLTEVTFSMRNNVYMYAAYKLWLAYGLAIAVSTLVVIFGLFAIYMNDASYSDDFSSLLRLCRGAQLSGGIDLDDLDGKDPRPSYLGATEIKFFRSSRPGGADSSEYLPVSKEQCKDDKTLFREPENKLDGDASPGAQLDDPAWTAIHLR